MGPDNPLWQYALALYARSGVEQCCLRLQDQGATVNCLLLACWSGTQGVVVDAERWRSLDAFWRHEVTEPLRHIRHQVRSLRARQPQVEACYRALQQAELAAEQVELQQLWQTARHWLPAAEAGSVLIRANLATYSQLLPQPLAQAEWEQLAAAATELSLEDAELSSGQSY